MNRTLCHPPHPRCAGGILSANTLNVGGLSTSVTLEEVSETKENPCGVDGVVGMGRGKEGAQNAFKCLLDVSVTFNQ